MLQVLPSDDLPGMRDEVAKGVVPSNDPLDKFLDEYKEAVDRRLHVESIRPRRQKPEPSDP